MHELKSKSLRESAISGSIWTILGFGFSQVLRLAGNIVLAKYLFPEAFALMAIVAVIFQGFAMMSDIGIGPNIIRSKRGNDQDFLDTAWTIQVIKGAILATVVSMLAWPIATFYAANDPKAMELRWLLPAVAWGVFIQEFQSSKMKTASRNLMIGRVTALQLVSQSLGISVMVIGAMLTSSIYAVVWGGIVSAAVLGILSHVVIPGKLNRFKFEKSAFHEIFHFGKWVFLSTAVSFLALQIDKIILMKIFPLAVMGVFSIASSLAIIAGTLIGKLQLSIIFPLYAKKSGDVAATTAMINKTKLPMLTIGAYLVTITIACSQVFINIAYDDTYSSAGLYIAIMVVGTWFGIIEGMYTSVLLANGNSRMMAIGNIVKVIVFILCVIPFVRMWGIFGAIAASIFSDFLRLIIVVTITRKYGMRLQALDCMLTVYVLSIGFGVHFFRYLPFQLPDIPPLFLLLCIKLAFVTVAFTPIFWAAYRRIKMTYPPQTVPRKH